MKKVLYACLLFLAGMAMGYNVTKQEGERHRQAACAWSDLCRMAYDHLGDSIIHSKGDIEDLYGDYTSDMECFGYSITEEELHNYYWCY